MSDAAAGHLVTESADADTGIQVLHVDDETDVLDLTKTFLEREDERITVATETDVDRAMDRLHGGTFDCVVSDHDMPGMTGLDFLENVRAEYPDLPFILFTGKGSEEIASRAISAGVTDYIQKGGLEKYAILANEIGTVASEYQATHALEWYRAAIEGTRDAVYVRDADNRFVAVNDSFLDLTGYDADRVIGSDPSLIKAPEAVDAVERHVAALRRHDGPSDVVFEVEVRPAAGEPIPCEDHMSPIRADDGTFRGTVGALRDITRRKERDREMAARLRQQEIVASLGRTATGERDFDVLLTDLADGIAEGLDADHAMVFEYRSTAGDLRLRADTGVNDEPPESVTVPADDGSQAGFTLRAEDPIVVGDLADEDRFEASEFLVEHGVVSGISVRVGPPDDPWGVLGVHDDRSRDFNGYDVDFVRSAVHVLESALERRVDERHIEALNDRLRRRTDQLESFARVLSHDLRNPLNIALGRLQLAREHDDESSLDQAETAISRAVDLVEDLTGTMRHGVQLDDVETCDTARVARRAWDAVGSVDGTFVVEGATPVEADPGALQRVFENLFRNAIEHGGDDVTVTVEATGAGFAVADDGPGIPPDERDRVFEAGYSSKDDGTGIGLLSVQQVVLAHGWDVAVDESDAGGARFEVAVDATPGP